MIRIAVDAMGGDNGSQVVIRGVIEAAKRSSTQYLLVGKPREIEAELSLSASRPGNIDIVAASEIIEMTENPVEAFRRKPDASVTVCAQLVKDGKADGFVTIANTGAAVTISMMTLKRIRGVDRPAIATTLPTICGKVVLLDAGATPDCDSNNLYEFALMAAPSRKKFTA